MQWNKTVPHSNSHDNQCGPGDVPGAETERTGEIPIPIWNTTKTLPAKAGSTFPSVRAETQEPCAHWMAQSRQSLYKHCLHAIRGCHHNNMEVRNTGNYNFCMMSFLMARHPGNGTFWKAAFLAWWERHFPGSCYFRCCGIPKKVTFPKVAFSGISRVLLREFTLIRKGFTRF